MQKGQSGSPFNFQEESVNKKNKKSMNKKRFLTTGKTAMLLSVCAATALCVNLVNSCSADDDDVYYGDELKTRAKATRSASSESPGTDDSSVYESVEICHGEMSDTKTLLTNNNDHISVTVKLSWGDNEEAPSVSVSQQITSVDIPQTLFGNVSKELYIVNSNFPHSPAKALGVKDSPRTFTTWVDVSYKLVRYDVYGNFIGYGAEYSETLEYTFDVTNYTTVNYRNI